MELGSILGFLENSSILVTGATGFLAKVFIEKILRVQPNVKKLYLLLRAPDDKSAMLRFNTEAVAKDLFRVLREMHKERFSSFLSQKVRIVPGDITCDDLGVDDSNLLDEMRKEVDVVVNIAATTNFDERYDVALKLNTMGAKNVLDFAKKCLKPMVLLHVSTAYVSGEKQGLILETPYKIGDTLNGTSGLDIYEEKKLMEDTLQQLEADQNCSQDYIKSAMKEFGMQRSRKYGWPNTYVFTKAMGEMLLGEFKEDIPVVIIRPTIVTSTLKEPFPGWVEGMRTIDSLAMGYGKGRITCFLGNPKSTIDIIPADMVVNAMIVAIAAHVNRPTQTIYHVGSSVSSPVEFTWLQDWAFNYFTKHPWINNDGKPVIVREVKVLDTKESFQRYMTIHFLLPLKALQIVNIVCCQYFQSFYLERNRKIKFVMRLIDLYAPYLFFNGYYDDMNTEKLRRAAEESGAETDDFCFDPKRVDWEDYFMNTHFPGLVKSLSSSKKF